MDFIGSQRSFRFGSLLFFMAHQLPDMVGAYVTPLGLVVLLFAFDWRFGLICLIPIVLSFVVMMVFMTGPTLKVKMQEYQNALEDMSNEAVEYVRGVPVVKTFGQTVYSFEKFKKSIDRYSEWAISYTKSMRIPMCLLTILINGIFAFILAAGIWFTEGGISTTLVLNILFYIILTPILTVTRILTHEKFRPLISGQYDEAAREISTKMQRENGVVCAADAIEKYVRE